MWKVPVTAAEALRYVVDAARRERYLGLMVILARTAEARTLHEELVRDWTSIHDVTGQSIAVLCPDPRFVLSESEEGRYYAFENNVTRYWKNLTLDEARDLPHTRLVLPRQDSLPRGQPVPLPPYPAEVLQAAWTEAVTRCATYFGIRESRLPAVLVLCLRDERDVLIQLRPQTSIYQLCKRIASHPGHEPGDEERMEERDALAGLVKHLAIGFGHHALVPDNDPPRTMRRLLTVAKVSAQFEGLHKHLSMIAHVDPELNLAWCTGLDELTDSDADHNAVLSYLSEMAQAVQAHPRRTELLSLNKKARKVERAVKAAADPPPEWRYLPESPAARAKREAERARAQAKLAELERVLNSRPGLAAACETAARAELGACEIAQLELDEYIGIRRGYHTQRIHAVTPVGPPPDDDANTATHNDISGTVHGVAVQAGHIDAVHFHGRRRLFGTKRRRGRQQ
ncbi:MAG TPA: hypothetical protein VGX25_23375 [Actinophytocola sp.]|uniref:hypothetical protein n=1 Tax=Actinophytocola sp. TaxID=1872138 RepID=UPI002DDD7BB7|nr:hypothetical protein [Actinophytocola sp.]HEV2782344.1 hypothetical protein [Actinophytocola sp.]